MGCLYILGALFYALRVPERFFPGKFDIWVSFCDKLILLVYTRKSIIYYGYYIIFVIQFQSHQIFHVLVIAAAFVHYHGITEMAMHRMTIGDCTNPSQVLAF